MHEIFSEYKISVFKLGNLGSNKQIILLIFILKICFHLVSCDSKEWQCILNLQNILIIVCVFKVEAYGPGVQKTGVVIGQPTEFTIDCRKAGGHAPLDVNVMDEDCKPVDLKVTDLKDGTFKATYKPTKLSKHTVQVNYGAVAIPKSPFRVNASFIKFYLNSFYKLISPVGI